MGTDRTERRGGAGWWARRGGPLSLAAAGLFAASGLPGPLPLHAAALLVTFCWSPGGLSAPFLIPAGSRAERALLSLCLAPFLAGGCGALLLAAGLDAGAAGRAVALLLAAGAGAAAIRPAPRAREGCGDARGEGRGEGRREGRREGRGKGGRGNRGEERGERATWIAAIAWTALMAILLLANRNLLPRSDGWFHAAVTDQIARRGLPPEDPFFAGLRLLYFWGAHVWAGLWVGLRPGLGVWTPLVALNLSGALAAVLGVCLLARRLGAGTGGIVASALVATFGYAPFAWVWVALRAIGGEVRGLAEIERLMTGGVTPALQSMSTGLLHFSMVFFGGKFLVLTPFALGLGLFAAFLIALLDLTTRPSGRAAIALSLLTAASLFLHTFVGICCVALSGGAWIWLGARAALGKDGSARRVLLPLLLATAGAVAVLAPYLATILEGKGNQLASGFTLKAIATWLWGGALVVPAGIVYLARRGCTDARARTLLVLAALLSAAALAVAPSDNNQSKFMNLLFLLLAAPAGPAWIEWLGRLKSPIRTVAYAAFTAAVGPTVALCLWAYAGERGQTAEGWAYATPLDAQAFTWARENTPQDAIFVEPEGGRLAPVRAGRSVLWGGEIWARKWGYPEDALDLRRRAASELSSGTTTTAEVRRFLAALGREVVVVWWRRRVPDAPESGAPARQDGFPRSTEEYVPIYSNADVVFYRWIGDTGATR